MINDAVHLSVCHPLAFLSGLLIEKPFVFPLGSSDSKRAKGEEKKKQNEGEHDKEGFLVASSRIFYYFNIKTN